MSFGKNPHVPKAQVAEQKARDAGDDIAREQAWREAARMWDRAAEREMEGKRRSEYQRNAENARARADGAEPPGEDDDGAGPAHPKPVDPRSIN